MTTEILDDEPAQHDLLGRDKYARALARVAQTCQTPIVIGVYGTWGVGKTSLMRLVQKELNPKKTLSIWFDPWHHQFEEYPALALAQALVTELRPGSAALKLVAVIAAAFGSKLLQITTGLTIKDVEQLGQKYEDDAFAIRDARIRLREHFARLIQEVRKDDRRIVFFIDDLDRCLPAHVLKVLESLKLYLNIEGCVYFLGVDKLVLEQSIKHHYKDIVVDESRYLDKIVQLPFTLPSMVDSSISSYIGQLLNSDLKKCDAILARGLGDNPRVIKRFVNSLTLNHYLALEARIPQYDPRILAALLLIQYREPEFFVQVLETRNEGHSKAMLEAYAASPSNKLSRAFALVDVKSWSSIASYLYLTQLVQVTHSTEPEARSVDLHAILAAHKQWLDSDGHRGRCASLAKSTLVSARMPGEKLRKADFAEADLSEADLVGADMSSANMQRARCVGTRFVDAILVNARFSHADLTRCDLRRADLRQADLSHADLSDADLTGAKLAGSFLQDAKLVRANLQDVDLTDANIQRTDFSDATVRGLKIEPRELFKSHVIGFDFRELDLFGSDLRDLDLRHGDLSGRRLRRANCTGALLTGARLINAELEEALLANARLDGADLTGANMNRTVLRGANLRGAILSAADLANAELQEAVLTSARLDDTDLTGANLTRAVLRGANLRGAVLSMADLANADLYDADLTGAVINGANFAQVMFSGRSFLSVKSSLGDVSVVNLHRLDFAGMDLHDMDLSVLDLTGANFTRVNLRGANLSDAILRRANLTEADLSGACLDGIDLTGAVVTGANFADAELDGAILTGVRIDAAKNLDESQRISAVIDDIAASSQRRRDVQRR